MYTATDSVYEAKIFDCLTEKQRTRARIIENFITWFAPNIEIARELRGYFLDFIVDLASKEEEEQKEEKSKENEL